MDLIANFRKGLASVVSTAVIAMTIVAVPSAQAAWYDVYVNALTDAGVVSSDFNPAADTTRLGFTTALVKAAGLGMSDNDAGFADVNNGYVNAAVENGIIDGPKAEKGNNFFPSNNINRAEVTKVVLEALGVDVAAYASPAAPHADVAADQWFAQYVSAAYNLSIVDGVANSTESFDPAGNIKDAAMSKIIAYGVIASADPENHVRFDDGVSAFSVYEESDIATNVVALVKVDMGSETETETETETGTEVVVSDGSLEVSLSPESPATNDIPGTVQGVKYLSVDFTAAGDDVKVSSVTVSRSGLGSRSDFDKVWLEKNGKRVTSKKTINSDDQSILTVLGGGFTVDAGETVTIDVIGSMSASSGQINRLSVVSADAVASNGESVVGDFPINGAEMKTTSYTVTKLRVEVKGSAETVDVNDEAVTIGEFDLAVQSTSDKDAYVREIVLENEGTSDLEGVLENIQLFQSGTLVSEEVTVAGDVVRIFLGEEGFLIEDGDTKRFTLKGDLVDGEEGKTLIFQVKEREDIVAIESGTGFATTNFEGSDFTSNSLADYNATATYTINAGKITISLDTTSPTNQDTSRDASAVTFLVGEIKVDQPIRVDGLKVYLHSDSAFDDNIGGTSGGPVDDEVDDEDIEATLENVKLYIGNSLVDSIDAVNSTVTAGTDSVVSGDIRKLGSSSLFYYDFDSTFDITETTTFKVVADIKDATLTGSRIKFTVAATNFTSPEYISTGDSVVSGDISGSATSNLTTVIASSATITRNDGYADGETFVAGAKGVKLGQFVVEAGSASAVDVRKLVFNFARDNDGDVAAGTEDLTVTDFANIKLMVGDTQLGDTDDLTLTTSIGTESDDSGTVSFDGFNYTIAKSGQATFSIYSDIESSATAITDLHVYLDTSSSTIEDEQNDTVSATNNFEDGDVAALTISAGGTLTVAADGDTPETQLVVANSADVELAKYKLTATDEAIEVTDFYFMNDTDDNDAADTAADSRFSALKLYVGGELLDSRVPTSGKVQFDLGTDKKVTVPKNSSVVVTIKGDLNTITSAAQTGEGIRLSMYAVEANSTGTGNAATVSGVSDSDNTTTLTTNVDADIQYIVKTRPTLTTQTLSTSKLVSGQQTLYKVSVAADANEDVEVATIAFDVSGKVGGNVLNDSTDATDDVICYESGADDGDCADDTVALNGFKLFINGSEVTSSKYARTIVETSDVFAIQFALTSGNEETIAGGSSKVFELKATAAGVVSDDYTSVKVTEDTGFSSGANYAGTTGNFVWSDNAGSPHTRTTVDWFDGTEVNGLDTATTTLQN